MGAGTPVRQHAVQLRTAIDASIAAKQTLLKDKQQLVIFNKLVDLVVTTLRNGGRLYIAGNGGSAADAQHLAAEFVGRFAMERAPLPAEALTTNTSILTAIANDYGYEYIFTRQLMAKACADDVFLGITTTGDSHNILSAIRYCTLVGIPSILFTGHSGGLAADFAKHVIIVPSENTATIQEIHLALEHALCSCVETALFR